MLAGPSLDTDKPAPSALQLPGPGTAAKAGERPEATCLPESRNSSRKAMAEGASGGSRPLLFPHC